MSTNSSPLHKVIDSRQWDAADLVARLSIVVHAAFIDAGFVLAGSKLHQPPWIYKKVRRQNAKGGPGAVVRLHVQGDLVIFYSYLASDADRSRVHWESMDARAIVRLLLSGSLDDTALALERDATGVRLWKDVLADGLCRPILHDLLQKQPRFMSLPDDLIAAILARLWRGEYLAAVECTCNKLRRLVADRDGELWKQMYIEIVECVPVVFRIPVEIEIGRLCNIETFKRLQDMAYASSTTWKGRYMSYSSVARSIIESDDWFRFRIFAWGWGLSCFSSWYWEPTRAPLHPWRNKKYCKIDARYDRSPIKDPLELLSKSNAQVSAGDRYNNKRRSVQCWGRRDKGTIHSSSSKYRWMHR
ncbi:unnamed protein product [Urochloa decumbens]|uniref:F-box domain-containing protein n=1 Tax=Urochloa decumbens TaxID=240449 RepID=A0ABC8YE96_9POAL